MKKLVDLVTEMTETFAISLAIFLAIYAFLAFPEIVVGASMEPTLHTGERLFVERISPKIKKLNRGDIIIFNPPGNNSVDYVKRVVGLPGEKIKIIDCSLFLINSDNSETKLTEPYLSDGTCTKVNEVMFYDIPSNSYFVLGDNREHSADSRVFGSIQLSRIDGKVFFRFWPPNKFKTF